MSLKLKVTKICTTTWTNLNHWIIKSRIGQLDWRDRNLGAKKLKFK
jgi:hypothetical protein